MLLRDPCADGINGDARQVNTTRSVLDDDQGVDALEQDRVHVNEIGCDDAARLRGQELLPGRALAPGSRVNPGIVQDRPTQQCHPAAGARPGPVRRAWFLTWRNSAPTGALGRAAAQPCA